MVNGLDKFKEYFNEYDGSYIVIGGTACSVVTEEAGLTARATKDIDMILVVEALSPEFVAQFWQFITDGEYAIAEKGEEERQYYRFNEPANEEFPKQIELFCRKPDAVDLQAPAHLTPVPVEEGLSSLSAILMNDDYYSYLVENTRSVDGLHIANTEALICLKAKAYLEIKERIDNGSDEDAKHMKKHKADVFRMAAMLTADDKFELPESIYADMSQFAELVAEDLPDKAIMKVMGLGNVNMNELFAQLLNNFNLNILPTPGK